jgi:acetate kinase
MSQQPILVINSGSSSLKIGLFNRENGDERQLVDGLADGIGGPAGTFVLKDARGEVLYSEKINFASQSEALEHAAQLFAKHSPIPIFAIGHRIVHGGPHLLQHQRITGQVLTELKARVHFAPLHIPVSLALIDRASVLYPNVSQFACFDTAFHSSMPEVAARFAIPDSLFQEGIHRYGFHGLSYESIVYQLDRELPEQLVVAHLGNGASLAAIRSGKSADTSMGLTPTGGIPMATRSGDLDPGVILYLQRVKKMNADALESLLNKDSGLKALSGGKSDMRDLQDAADAGDAGAQLAIDVFCFSVRKVVAAYAAVLGGLDMLVFAAGIGEHSVRVRAKVCEGLAFLGVALDSTRNEQNKTVISSTSSKISVRVMSPEEDLQIARHCRALSL